MSEQWKAIHNFPGYEVSDQGRVRSYWKQQGRKRTIDYSSIPKILKPHFLDDRYLGTGLNKNKKQFNKKISRLVLEAFVSPCPNGMEASHLNGNSADNRLENLVWESHLDNCQRKKEHGTLPITKGEKNGSSKLTEKEVIKIRNLKGFTQTQLAKFFGVTPSNISLIIRNKHWAHV